MNSGSIDNPRTKEGQLYALFSANIGREFTTMQIGQHIQSWAAHTYIDGCRDQVEARGEYRVLREQRGKLHYYRMVHAVGQMELAGVGG